MNKKLNLVDVLINKPITEIQSENHQIQIPLDNEVKSVFLNEDLKVSVQVPNTLVDVDCCDKQKITDAKSLETRAADEDTQEGHDQILQAIDQYYTSEPVPFNSYKITECKRMSLYSVTNGLKNRWDTLISLGRLTEDEKKTKMECVDSVLGLVSKNENDALIEEFLTVFFGKNVNFYGSCKKRVGIPFDKMESILTVNSGEKYLVLKEPCENFDVYIDDKSNVYPKDSKPNIDSLHLAKTLDRDFKCSEFDGSIYEEVKKAEETETKNFIKKLRHLLEHFTKSSIIREYLGLLIIVRKFFCSDSEIGVLLENDSEDAQFNIYRSSVNGKIRNCFRLGKFREDKEGNLYNIDNLLTIFHEMGHFVAYALMGCCDVSSGEDNEKALYDVDTLNYEINRPWFTFTKELVGIREEDTESWQMINELYDAIWDGKFVEPMQIIGVCQYENSVLLNNYNDLTLLMAVHDINPSIPVFLRNSHGTDAVSDENSENENNIPD
ncbi:MAG: hypothetical protein K2L13_01860, partial [Opitutales bacterium]|nr:hypothetical protein [Opitutales bacterium]